MITCKRARTSLKFGWIRPLNAALAALEHLKKSPYAYNGKTNVSTFSRLFLIRSLSYLQVMITYMRAWISLKFSQIQPLVSMVTDRVMTGKMVSVFHPFLFILVGMVTCIRARTSSNLGLIGPLTAELAALERLKKSP